MDFIDNCLDICLFILMVSIIILIGIEIVLLIIRAISTYKEDKEEDIKEEKKDYLVHITFREQILDGSHITKLIYVKATSPKEALKHAEEYYMEHCSIPALKSLYEKGKIVIIARCIDDCAIIW